MFWIGPLIEFGGQERYELDRITSVIHTYHNYLVGMDSDGLIYQMSVSLVEKII